MTSAGSPASTPLPPPANHPGPRGVSDQPVTVPPAVPARRGHRWWLLAIAIALPTIGLAVPPLYQQLDGDPRALMTIGMLSQLSVLLGVFLSLLWLFVLSRFSWTTKGVAALILTASVGTAASQIKRVEFTGDMQPIVIWKGSRLAMLSRPKPPTPATTPAVATAGMTESETAAAEPVDGGDATSTSDQPVRLISLQAGPNDFPRYRGRHADGQIIGLALELPATGGNWQPAVRFRQPCGGGYAGFAVAGEGAVTIEQRDSQEVVVCYRRSTGEEAWAYGYSASFEHVEPMGGNGPRATPTIDGDEVFSLGAKGHLVCLEGATGRLKWSVNILEDCGAKNVEWGMTGAPLVVGSLVIVNPGVNPEQNANQSLAAYDRQTGKRVWASGSFKAGYSSPQLGQEALAGQVLLFDAGGLAGYRIEDGRPLWQAHWPTVFDMNVVQPLQVGPARLLASSSPEEGSFAIDVSGEGDQWESKSVWSNRNLYANFCNPVLSNGHAYGMSNGILTCINVDTGARQWKGGRYGAGQLLLVADPAGQQDQLLILSEAGELALVPADPKKFRELAKLPVLEGKTWNTPAIAGRELWVRNHREMSCLDLPGELVEIATEDPDPSR